MSATSITAGIEVQQRVERSAAQPAGKPVDVLHLEGFRQ